MRLDWAAVPEAAAELHIDAVGAGVLRDDEQFLHACLHEAFRFTHDVADGAADQVAAHGRNDAEAATVIAAFRDLQVGIVARRQLHALRRHEVYVGIVIALGRHGVMDGAHDLFVLLGARNGQHGRVDFADEAFFHAHASRHDDLAVLGNRLADRFEGFGLGAVDEAAGVHQHDIGVVVFRRDGVTLGAQLGENAF